MELLIVSGPDRDTVFPLNEGESLLIGRGDGCDVQLHDPRISRKRCMVALIDNNVTVTDCNSSGGTYLNQKKIDSGRWLPGGLMKIGTTEIRLCADSDLSEEQTLPTENPKQEKLPIPIGDDLSNLIGRTIHDYTIEKSIARGKMGEVFLARQSTSGERLALKVLWPSVSQDKEAIQRFIRAMKTMRPLRHPNIIRLYNAGKVGPYCWLAMEYVAGENLNCLIHRVGTSGMVDWQTAFRVAMHVARALEAAAAKKILHRNITPTNIIIQSKGKSTKLGDLMFAKALEAIAEDDITATGELVGDLTHLSPEATYGTRELDSRSDIYGLGATLYSMLAGQPPFVHKAATKLIELIRSEKPTRPNRQGFATNQRFERIVMRMLEKRPEDRYQTASELLEDLQILADFQGIKV
jgi:serine/threonine protein kinase